ncbi:hypothetical protein BC829DRAFT_398855 [Chytridium lagenaria]|nr:hypothetical protein BC829DRAFT_398855 [Chytridium lagenaria]
MCEVFAEMVFCHGVVHCDPHPGNVLVVKSPLGHGLPQLVTLDDRFRVLYCDLWRAMVFNDVELMKRVAADLGVEGISGRPAGSTTPLGGEITNITFADLMTFLKDLPRDMLFAFRVGNLIRGIHRELFLDDMVVSDMSMGTTREEARMRMLKRIKEDPGVRAESVTSECGEDGGGLGCMRGSKLGKDVGCRFGEKRVVVWLFRIRGIRGTVWRPWTILRETKGWLGMGMVVFESLVLEMRYVAMRGVLCDGPVTPAIAEVTKAKEEVL